MVMLVRNNLSTMQRQEIENRQVKNRSYKYGKEEETVQR